VDEAREHFAELKASAEALFAAKLSELEDEARRERSRYFGEAVNEGRDAGMTSSPIVMGQRRPIRDNPQA
jgi:hypothetical protein